MIKISTYFSLASLGFLSGLYVPGATLFGVGMMKCSVTRSALCKLIDMPLFLVLMLSTKF